MIPTSRLTASYIEGAGCTSSMLWIAPRSWRTPDSVISAITSGSSAPFFTPALPIPSEPATTLALLGGRWYWVPVSLEDPGTCSSSIKMPW